MRYKFLKKSHFVYLSEKPMIPHLLRYQGLAVDDYDFVLMPQIWGIFDFRSFRVSDIKSPAYYCRDEVFLPASAVFLKPKLLLFYIPVII